MIKKIHSRSLVGDVSTTTSSMLNDIDKRDFSADVYMGLQFGKLKDINALLTEAIKEKAANSILAPIDEKRDNNLRVIFYEVDAKVHWTNKDINQAATVVEKELDKYGIETTKLAYAVESASINALLKDLEKTNVKEAIALLPELSNLIQELDASQREFEAAYLQFVGLTIAKQKLLSASKLRNLIREQINEEFIVYMNGMALSGGEVYKDCAKVMEKLIENNNQKVRERLNRQNKKDDDDDSSST